MKLDHPTLWLILPLTLAVAPLVWHLPFWVSGFWVLAIMLKLLRPDRAWPVYWLLPLAAGVFLGVLAEFRTIIGPQAGVSLLVAMSGTGRSWPSSAISC